MQYEGFLKKISNSYCNCIFSLYYFLVLASTVIIIPFYIQIVTFLPENLSTS